MKKVFLILLFAIFFFIFPTPTFAEENDNCTKVTSTIEKYNTSVEKLRSLNCENITTNDEYQECTKTEMDRSISLSNIFRYNETKSNCSTELATIVEQNKDSCSSIFDDSFKEIVSFIMNSFYVVAPFLIIIFGSLDFMKVLTSSSNKDAQKAKKNFIKRLTAFVLLYLVPVIINFIIGFIGTNNNFSGKSYTCKTEKFKPNFNSSILAINKNTKTISKIMSNLKRVSSENNNNNNNSSTGTSDTTPSNYTTSTSSDLTQVSNNGAFKIRGDNDRVTASSAPEYYVNGKTVSFQCVWYARARAQEIIGTSTTLSEDEKKKRIDMLNKAGADGWGWYNLAQGNGPLSKFQSSNNYKDVRAGAIVAWSGGGVSCKSGPGGKCGHVGIIEDYDPKTNIVRVSEAGKNGGTWSTYFWASREGTLEDSVFNKQNGKYKFLGYVFLLEPLK